MSQPRKASALRASMMDVHEKTSGFGGSNEVIQSNTGVCIQREESPVLATLMPGPPDLAATAQDNSFSVQDSTAQTRWKSQCCGWE